jgi:hypothetical protein
VGPPTIRNAAGSAASCSAYRQGLLVVPTNGHVPAWAGSRRPRVRGTHGATAPNGASMTTSTEYSHPTARCSSSMATGLSSAGGSNPSARTSTVRTRSIRYARRPFDVCDQRNSYHPPWRTTTAHGSTSASHSEPASEPYPRRTRPVVRAGPHERGRGLRVVAGRRGGRVPVRWDSRRVPRGVLPRLPHLLRRLRHCRTQNVRNRP